MENLAVNIGGLKCDNPDCNYRDDSIKLEQYEDYINEPCPVCGSPLLTQEDYDQVQNILSLVAFVNTLPPIPEGEEEGKSKVSFEFNGTGKVRVSVEDYKDQ